MTSPASTITTTTTGEPLLTEGTTTPPATYTDEQLVVLIAIRGLVGSVVAITTDEELIDQARQRGYELTDTDAVPDDAALELVPVERLVAELGRRNVDVTRYALDAQLLATLATREHSLPEVADLGRPCTFCKAAAGLYCRTSTGAPTLSHAARRAPA